MNSDILFKQRHCYKLFAFEPDPVTFLCLNKNLRDNEMGECYKIALSNKNSTQALFIDSEGGNSSLDYFGTEKSIEVESKKLDDLNFKNIKLLKLKQRVMKKKYLKGQ